MIRVPVGSVRTEGHDYIGPNSPYMRDDGVNGSCGLAALEIQRNW